jgi:hypothetical protein
MSTRDQLAPSRPDNVAEDAPVEDPVDFDNLVSDIIDNPELLLTAKLTVEQVLEVQRRINPYAGIAGPAPGEDVVRIAACSYTNLREDYLRRLTMTSLVGFIFQMSKEWDVPASARQWTPDGKVAAADLASRPCNPQALVERLEATLAIAKEAAAADAAAAESKRAAAEMDVVLPANASGAARAAVERQYVESSSNAAKAAGLLYAATHATHRCGVDAGHRLRATAEAGMEFPEVKSIIGQFPLPLPPSQVEMPADVAKNIIDGFLRNWFEFDPSAHVRSGHDAKTINAAVEMQLINGSAVPVDTADPGHLTVEAVRAGAPAPNAEHRGAVQVIMASKSSYNAVAALLRDDALAAAAFAAVQDPDTFKHYLFPVAAASAARPAADVIPPQDTFHRWGYYTEVNYEELRIITEAIYPERPDLDWALALWDVFEGTQDEVDKAFEKHCQRYQDETPSALKALEFGNWSLLADFKQNRKKIQFYNKNTEVLKRILDRHTEDKRIGADLMRNRVRQTKARNIATDGPDAAGLKAYKRNVAEKGQDLGAKGVERVIGAEEMRRLERARGNMKAAKELELLDELEKTIKTLGEMETLRALTADEARELKSARSDVERVREMVRVPDDAIQVDVFTSNPSTGGFAKSHFYSKAEAPEHLDKTAAEKAAGEAASDHPAVANSMPKLAPFAVDHILSANRSPEAQRQEAIRDAK